MQHHRTVFFLAKIRIARVAPLFRASTARCAEFHSSLSKANSRNTDSDVDFYRQQLARDGTRTKKGVGAKAEQRPVRIFRRKGDSAEEGRTRNGDSSKEGITANVRTFAEGPVKFPPSDLDVFVSCLPGLESVLSLELTALKVNHKVDGCGARLLDPTSDDIMDCHLYLGTASTILLGCGEPFVARGLAELRRKTFNLPWRRILKRNIHLDARVISTKSKLYHTTAIRDRITSAIYESLGYDAPEDGTRYHPPEVDGETVRLDIKLHKDNVFISIDTSTTPLHQRGYRLQTAKAPLREDLAFGLLLAAGWTPLYHEAHRRDNRYAALLDIFCGSGTIAIEGACMAAGFPPGRLRPAPLAGTKFQNESKWLKLIKDASPGKVAKKSLRNKTIFASDRDAGAVNAAKLNASRAGVLEFMEIEMLPLASHPWFEVPDTAPRQLLIASNPPFGKRISPPKKSAKGDLAIPSLLPLYQTLGHRIHRLREAGREVGAILLTDDPQLVRRTGLDGLSVKFKTKHGGIPVSAMLSTSKHSRSEQP
jgi:putative N6-adenine-specific DNA methylase